MLGWLFLEQIVQIVDVSLRTKLMIEIMKISTDVGLEVVNGDLMKTTIVSANNMIGRRILKSLELVEEVAEVLVKCLFVDNTIFLVITSKIQTLENAIIIQQFENTGICGCRFHDEGGMLSGVVLGEVEVDAVRCSSEVDELDVFFVFFFELINAKLFEDLVNGHVDFSSNLSFINDDTEIVFVFDVHELMKFAVEFMERVAVENIVLNGHGHAILGLFDPLLRRVTRDNKAVLWRSGVLLIVDEMVEGAKHTTSFARLCESKGEYRKHLRRLNELVGDEFAKFFLVEKEFIIVSGEKIGIVLNRSGIESTRIGDFLCDSLANVHDFCVIFREIFLGFQWLFEKKKGIN